MPLKMSGSVQRLSIHHQVRDVWWLCGYAFGNPICSWSKLANDITKSESLSTFKTKVKSCKLDFSFVKYYHYQCVFLCTIIGFDLLVLLLI